MQVSDYTLNKVNRGSSYNGVRDVETPIKYSSLKDSAPKSKINIINKLKDKTRDQYYTNSRGDQVSDSKALWRQRSPVRNTESRNLSPDYSKPRNLETSINPFYASKSEMDESLTTCPEIVQRRSNIRKRPISVSRNRNSRASTPKPNSQEKAVLNTKSSPGEVQVIRNIYTAPAPDRSSPGVYITEASFEPQPPTTMKPKHMRRKSENCKVSFPTDLIQDETEHLKVPVQQSAAVKFKRATARRLTDMTSSHDFMIKSANLDILMESTYTLENKPIYPTNSIQIKVEPNTSEQRTGSISPSRSKTYKRQIVQERLPKQSTGSSFRDSKTMMLTDSTGLTSQRTDSFVSNNLTTNSSSREEARYTISLNESSLIDRSPLRKSDTISRSDAVMEETRRSDAPTPTPMRDYRGLLFDPMAEGIHGINKRWKVSKNIGNGGISQVYKAMDVNHGTIFAVKRISYTPELTTNLRVWEQEIKILEKYKHPNIIQYLGSECEGDQLYIYLEYADGGSLSSLLNRIGAFEERTVKNYIGQILRGLSYLHRNDIIHRDIKAENVLLDRETIKLSDFGCSRQYSDRTKSGMINSVAGTFLFMAPEVIRSEHYGRSIDIWSLGCLTIQLLTARSPWPEFDSVFHGIYKIATGLMPTIPENISPEAEDFIRSCLNREPSLRKTAEQLLEHKFIVS